MGHNCIGLGPTDSCIECTWFLPSSEGDGNGYCCTVHSSGLIPENKPEPLPGYLAVPGLQGPHAWAQPHGITTFDVHLSQLPHSYRQSLIHQHESAKSLLPLSGSPHSPLLNTASTDNTPGPPCAQERSRSSAVVHATPLCDGHSD